MIVILIVGWRVGDVLHLSMRKAKEFIYEYTHLRDNLMPFALVQIKVGGSNIYPPTWAGTGEYN